MVPNFLKVFASSPSALRAFLGLHSIVGEGSLDAPTRERIALVEHRGEVTNAEFLAERDSF